MTEDETRLEIGRLVEERQNTRGALVCIERRLRRIRLALDRTQFAIDEQTGYRLDEDSGKLIVDGLSHIRGCEETGEHPEGREIGTLLDERRQLKERLAELEEEGKEFGI